MSILTSNCCFVLVCGLCFFLSSPPCVPPYRGESNGISFLPPPPYVPPDRGEGNKARRFARLPARKITSSRVRFAASLWSRPCICFLLSWAFSPSSWGCLSSFGLSCFLPFWVKKTRQPASRQPQVTPRPATSPPLFVMLFADKGKKTRQKVTRAAL